MEKQGCATTAEEKVCLPISFLLLGIIPTNLFQQLAFNFFYYKNSLSHLKLFKPESGCLVSSLTLEPDGGHHPSELQVPYMPTKINRSHLFKSSAALTHGLGGRG